MNEIKINKLAEMIMKEIGKPGTIECEESPTGSVSRRVPDLTKLNNYIKLSETTLCSGISTTVSWYKENE